MIRLVTYADERMTTSQQRCMDSANKMGVDDVRGFNTSWWKHWEGLDTFDWLNKETLGKERGAGYWIWKSWCIASSMYILCKDGDTLIYSDAGVEFIAPVSHIINRMDEDIFFFTNGHKHIEWCKGDVWRNINHFEVFNEGVSNYAELKQVQASVIFFKVNQKTIDFVKEWLLWCQMPGFITDEPSKIPNYPTFQEHRHDQSILTCLQISHGYKLHFWPTQYSGHLYRPDGDNYPIMFDHHRKRNNEWHKSIAI